jgi:hypothetical protein
LASVRRDTRAQEQGVTGKPAAKNESVREADLAGEVAAAANSTFHPKLKYPLNA